MENKREKLILALGGNAIGKKGQMDYQSQYANIEKFAKIVIDLIKENNEILIVHGNGPQVGDLLMQNHLAKSVVNPLPLDILNAQSQGYIGYMLEQSIKNQLILNGIEKEVVEISTRVEVDKTDPNFKEPTKPVGQFYTLEEKDQLLKENPSWIIKQDSNRGYRRLVPSPKPIDIIESQTIKELLDRGKIVIAGGGGGIPVIKNDNGTYTGIEAVIDKDLTGMEIATLVEGDKYCLITDVKATYIKYTTPQQQMLREVNIAQLEKYITDDEFSQGSMLPKIQAGIEFVKRTGKKTLITSLENLVKGVKEQEGTIIVK